MTELRSERVDSANATPDLLCPQCEAAYMAIVHCVLVCEKCGYSENCEDNVEPAELVRQR